MDVKTSTLIAFATIAWVSLAAGGCVWLAAYGLTEGASGDVLSRHPVLASGRSTGQYQLEMFIHPRCPCTRASVAQLAQVISRCGDRVQAVVWVFHPDDEPTWGHTDLWDAAETIPGVIVNPDRQGQRAAAFGAMTSGHVLLYDRGGDLVFSGGITAARGHEGDNLGCASVVELLKVGTSSVAQSPVFGCPISGEVDDAITRSK